MDMDGGNSSSNVGPNYQMSFPGVLSNSAFQYSPQGDSVYVFGGLRGESAAGIVPNGELWQLNVQSLQFSRLQTTLSPSAVFGSCMTISDDGYVWIYGGANQSVPILPNSFRTSNQFFKKHISRSNDEKMISPGKLSVKPIYGLIGLESELNTPGSRYQHSCWIKPGANESGFYLFGGIGFNGFYQQEYNDLWFYDFKSGFGGGTDYKSAQKYVFQNDIPRARMSGIQFLDFQNNSWIGFGGKDEVTYRVFGDMFKIVDTKMCNGTLWIDSSVCSGNGNCTDYNTCSCKMGASGVYCQDFMCSGYKSDNLFACHGVGRCIGLNVCSCYRLGHGEVCGLQVVLIVFYSLFGLFLNFVPYVVVLDCQQIRTKTLKRRKYYFPMINQKSSSESTQELTEKLLPDTDI
jgi:hypothetical protein